MTGSPLFSGSRPREPRQEAWRPTRPRLICEQPQENPRRCLVQPMPPSARRLHCTRYPVRRLTYHGLSGTLARPR